MRRRIAEAARMAWLEGFIIGGAAMAILTEIIWGLWPRR